MTGSAPILELETVISTQAVAFELAAEGAPDRTVVMAKYQSEGRGRRGRTWHAEPGSALLVSILLRPRLTTGKLPLLSFTTAVAVAEALVRLGPVEPRLKWPNDVLVGGRKIAGILLESRPVTESARDASETVVVIGIGLNLGQTEFPEDLGGRATSLRLETGVTVDRGPALAALLDAFDVWRGRLEREGFAPVRQRWLALADTIGRRVSADGVEGDAVDVAMDGALIVRAGVTVHRVVAGEVSEADASRR